MKKQPAVILLILGGALAVFGISYLNILLFLSLFPFGVLAAIALTAGAAFGIDSLRVLLAGKYGFSVPKFLLCAYAPSIAASAVYFAVVSYLDKTGYFKGYFAGMGEFLTGLSWLITSAAAAVLGIIMLIITSMIIARKEKSK